MKYFIVFLIIIVVGFGSISIFTMHDTLSVKFGVEALFLGVITFFLAMFADINGLIK